MKFVLLAMLVSVTACEKAVFTEGKMFAGGKAVDAETLNL